ncbi:Transcription factor HES-5 [Nibea albiflora]|uniref:Transcription factor HES-5 n=1 Tax=Nibea albiflora TaxID=240163 RepID=A0ACB7EL77_NIBAL|nr:Transcription factor HES-5 [Nibea albiflora]
MAPCSTNYSSIHHIRISERDNIKLRKPVVEKMRRDRINSCIEQLKIILEKEFHKQEPNSKLEKADILEMTSLQQQKKQLHQAQRASSSSPVCSNLRLQNSSSNSRGPMWRPW